MRTTLEMMQRLLNEQGEEIAAVVDQDGLPTQIRISAGNQPLVINKADWGSFVVKVHAVDKIVEPRRHTTALSVAQKKMRPKTQARSKRRFKEGTDLTWMNRPRFGRAKVAVLYWMAEQCKWDPAIANWYTPKEVKDALGPNKLRNSDALLNMSKYGHLERVGHPLGSQGNNKRTRYRITQAGMDWAKTHRYSSKDKRHRNVE
jgi:hypothetical protein